ncbi:hypothetical protein KAR91_04740 [Candidatus Pacearchaeota archaeon]|nr:hypothetical protein [Candidatus Pacearchaeota archaeon]
MSNMFTVDNSQLTKLLLFYATAPKKFAKASGSMLNHFAFGTRTEALNELQRRMTIRNQAFMKRQMRVEKSHTRLPIQSQVSKTGSVTTQRFTGWEEQETGKKTDKTRTFSLSARRGSRRKQALPSARLKPGRDLDNPNNYEGKDSYHRVLAMLSAIQAKKSKKPFHVFKGGRKISSGLYRFEGDQLTMLQKYATSNAQPKRRPWINQARARYFRNTDMKALWSRTISFVLKVR